MTDNIGDVPIPRVIGSAIRQYRAVRTREVAVGAPAWLRRFEIHSAVDPDWRTPRTWLWAIVELALPGSSTAGRARRVFLIDAVLDSGETIRVGVEHDEASADIVLRKALSLAQTQPVAAFRRSFACAPDSA
jgi:hypothetical protein